MSPRSPLVWVVGQGGLLGQHVAALCVTRGRLWQAEPIPWGEPARAQQSLSSMARTFVAAAEGGPWQVMWCAGAGVTGTEVADLRDEIEALRAALDGLPRQGSCGAVFLASSAGGVYAGVGEPPYDEHSPVRPLADYGWAKLEAEALLTQWGDETETAVLLGRISNLYGPGQNLAKAQGLISQICKAHLAGRPLQIWVSLDTMRDYVFAPDCAELVFDAVDRLRAEQAHADRPLAVTKILASHRAITVGAILGELRRVLRKPPRIVLGASSTSALQARDLSLRSVVWPDLDHRSLTPLPAGVSATLADLRRRMQQPQVG